MLKPQNPANFRDMPRLRIRKEKSRHPSKRLSEQEREGPTCSTELASSPFPPPPPSLGALTADMC